MLPATRRRSRAPRPMSTTRASVAAQRPRRIPPPCIRWYRRRRRRICREPARCHTCRRRHFGCCCGALHRTSHHAGLPDCLTMPDQAHGFGPAHAARVACEGVVRCTRRHQDCIKLLGLAPPRSCLLARARRNWDLLFIICVADHIAAGSPASGGEFCSVISFVQPIGDNRNEDLPCWVAHTPPCLVMQCPHPLIPGVGPVAPRPRGYGS